MTMDSFSEWFLNCTSIFALGVSGLGAQELPGSGLAQQNLRSYWHVFIAYAIAIVVVLGWVISIGRRLRDVEERLGG